MKIRDLDKYQTSNKELLMLWLNNYEFGEPLIDITGWVRFQSINEFAERLVIGKQSEEDKYFHFRLSLDNNEENALRDYLLKRKRIVINHILNRGSFDPSTHLYQLYLQYLPDKLNEVEKSMLLEGYLHTLANKKGEAYATSKRSVLEKRLI